MYIFIWHVIVLCSYENTYPDNQLVTSPKSPSWVKVGDGLGDFAVEIWGICIMGESCTKNHVNMLVGVLQNL